MRKRKHDYAYGYYDDDIKKMIDETTVCLNCGTPLKYLGLRSRNRGYCSMACYHEKPPKLAWLERVHGKPVRDIILEHLNSTGSVHITAELLGIGLSYFNKVTKKLNIKKVTKWV